MKADPILQEVWDIKDRLAAEAGYDIHAICADLRKRQNPGDPAHPLVQDARAWAETQERVLTLREEPPQPGEPQ